MTNKLMLGMLVHKRVVYEHNSSIAVPKELKHAESISCFILSTYLSISLPLHRSCNDADMTQIDDKLFADVTCIHEGRPFNLKS
jgi:hypothetical protein